MYGKWRGLCVGMVLMVLGACASAAENGPLVKNMGDYKDPSGQMGWEFVELLGLEKWGPTLNMYDNAALNGDPVMVLDSLGLFYRGQMLCTWPGGRFDQTKVRSMLLTNCPQGVPISSAVGGQGTGDARLVAAVFARQPNGLAQTTFNGAALYTFLGVEGTNWRPAPPPGT